MAGAVNTAYTFTDTDVITSSRMNNIIDETVMTSGAITGSTLAVSDGKLRVNTSGITANELATGSVTTTAILNANVTTAKIADSNVTTAKIADSNVTTAKIANDAVTTAKVLDSNITTAKIADASITAGKLSGAQTGSPPIYGARAFGTINILPSSRNIGAGSQNIASAPRIGTNDTTINFSTPMPNANYIVVATVSYDDSLSTNIASYDRTTSGFKLYHFAEGSNRSLQLVVFG